MNKHSELELKWEVHDVGTREFSAWMMQMQSFRVYKAENFVGTDYYFRRGNEVLRYRYDHATGHVQELTCKQRKSTTNIRDRVEVNVGLLGNTKPEDVFALVKALGFVEEVRLTKESLVFHADRLAGGCVAVVALYDVVDDAAPNNGYRRFLEVEIESNEHVGQIDAERALDSFARDMTERFTLASPLNASLYEIYTGNTYKMETE